jgi:hypothetical protein
LLITLEMKHSNNITKGAISMAISGNIVKASFLVLAISLTACSSTDDASSGTDVVATNSEEKESRNDDGIKCSYEVPTGTRFKKKICTSKKQRDEMKSSAAEQLRLRRNVRSTPIGT